MEYVEIVCENRVFKVKKEKIVYVLNRLSDSDFSEENDTTLLKSMEKYKLINEITLESLAEN